MVKLNAPNFIWPRQTWLWSSQTRLWLIVVLAIVLSAFYFKPWQTKVADTVSVAAEGKADATPDIAKITTTIESQNPNLDLARQENEKKVSQITRTLQDLNIDAKDIKTQNISGNQNFVQSKIYPVPPRPNTNQFTTTLEITIRNFDSTDQIISALTAGGTTNLYGPQLTLSDGRLEEAKSEARENAIATAKKKADQLAQSSGRKLGKVVKIGEQENFDYPRPLIAENQIDLKQKASQIQPGQSEVIVSLQVEYQLK